MIEQHYIWLESIVQRDQTLVMLAAIALYLVLPWIGLDWAGRLWSPRLVQWLRYGFLVGGAGVYVLTLAVSGAGGG